MECGRPLECQSFVIHVFLFVYKVVCFVAAAVGLWLWDTLSNSNIELYVFDIQMILLSKPA